jgi:feruloyl esterase
MRQYLNDFEIHVRRRLVQRFVCVLTVGGAMAALVPGVALGEADAALQGDMSGCTPAAIASAVPDNTTVTAVRVLDGPQIYCRVDGEITSMAPGPNTINFMVALPVEFNGRYYMINQGGNSGRVPNPPADLLAHGYAIAGTDTGNQDSFPIYNYLSDPAASLDQAWRGTHLTAVTTQQITRSFYGVDDMYRYAVGCSGGGRLGFTVASTHPEDFDGVVSGAPGGGISYPAQARIAQYGRLYPEAWISPSELALVDEAITEAFDGLDGVVDGVIWDPRQISYADVEPVLDFLTDDQLAWVELIMSDLKNPDGSEDYSGAIFPGYPITQTSAWSFWFMGSNPPTEWQITSPNPAAYGFGNAVFRAYFGENFDFVTDFDFSDQNQLDYFMNVHNAFSWHRSTPAELDRFNKAGGKIIIYADTSDHGAGFEEFIHQYEDMWRYYGSWQATQDFARFFLAPGTAHCGGGVGPQDVQSRAFDALVEWVENGIEPDQLINTRPATGRTFLLCAYPDRARYQKNKGAIDDATAWECQREYHPKR